MNKRKMKKRMKMQLGRYLLSKEFENDFLPEMGEMTFAKQMRFQKVKSELFNQLWGPEK